MFIAMGIAKGISAQRNANNPVQYLNSDSWDYFQRQ